MILFTEPAARGRASPRSRRTLRVGDGTAFLGTAHTLANFETANYLSALADTNSFEQWTDSGSLDMQQRANARCKQMLADYEPPDIAPDVDAALRDYVTRRKDDMPDEWY